jgi:DNA-binding response OmpR family regulator
MDIQLSGELSGLDVVRKLRDQGYKTPIIAVTAYAMAGDRERFLEAGCNDYMAKPLPVPQLVNLIQHYQELISDSVLLEEIIDQPANAEIIEERVVDSETDVPVETVLDEATQDVTPVRDDEHTVTRVAPKVDSVKTTQEEGKV